MYKNIEKQAPLSRDEHQGAWLG